MENNIENIISSLAVSPDSEANMGYKDIFYQLEQLIGADVSRVQELVQKNVITQNQGQYLYNQLLNKAKIINQYKLAQMQNVQPAQAEEAPVEDNLPQENPMDLFNKERPGFFESAGRRDILDYIKDFDKLINDCYKLLNNDGYLVFSQEHPFTTCIKFTENVKKGHTIIDNKYFGLFSDYNRPRRKN